MVLSSDGMGVDLGYLSTVSWTVTLLTVWYELMKSSPRPSCGARWGLPITNLAFRRPLRGGPPMCPMPRTWSPRGRTVGYRWIAR